MPSPRRAPHSPVPDHNRRTVLQPAPPSRAQPALFPHATRNSSPRPSGGGGVTLLTEPRTYARAPPRDDGHTAGSPPRQARAVVLKHYTVEQLAAQREYFHARPRCTLTEPPLVYATPILDQRKYTQPYCYAPLLFPCCAANEYRRAYSGKRRGSDGTMNQDSSHYWETDDGAGDLIMLDRYDDGDGRHITGDGATDSSTTYTGDDDNGNGNGDSSEVVVRVDADDSAGNLHGSSSTDANSNPLAATPHSHGTGSRQPQPQNGYASSPSGSRGRRHQHGRGGTRAQSGPNGNGSNNSRDGAGGCADGCSHLLYRCFCLRCSIAQQTDLLFREEERRQRYPYRFCCESLYGTNGSYARTLASIIVCDLLSGGLFIPCGLSYQGCGTALYGWRLRYLIRCRYSIYDVTFLDLLRMLCAPMQAVDQQGTEMAAHSLFERHGICYHTEMR